MLIPNQTATNSGLNARQAYVLNSTFVVLFGICALLNICAYNPALRQAAITLAVMLRTTVLILN